MGNLFSCSKKEHEKAPERPKLTPEEKAIIDCKQSRDKLKAYIKRLDNNEKSKKEQAKESLKIKDKDKAKYYLSQSKMYKIQKDNSQNQLAVIEDQIGRLDSAKTQKEVFAVLENTNKVLVELQKEVNIEKLEKISDDLNEIKANSDEITNFFKNHNVDLDENEDEINKEMEKLMKMEADKMEEELPSAKIDEKKKEGENKENKKEEENHAKNKRVMIEA